MVPAKPLLISPSRISAWRECKRRYAAKYILKIPLPTHPSAATGTETHGQLEKVLGGGDLDFTKLSGHIAANFLPFLPPPLSPGMELEYKFNFTSAAGHVYNGYIDLLVPNSAVFPGLIVPTIAPGVCDHKTTGNIAYAKTADALRTDPQGVIYAEAAFKKFDTKTLDLLWHYGLTKGARKTKRVHLRVHQPEVSEQMGLLDFTSSEIVATHQSGITSLLELPPTKAACGLYPPTGCPYKHLCTDLSVLNPQGKRMSASTEDMLNGLMNKLPAAERPPVKGLPDWMNDKSDTPINPTGEFQPPPAAVERSEEKPKTKKPTKKEKAAAEALLSASEPVAVESTTSVSAFKGFTLYVNCVPGKGATGYTEAEEIFAKADELIKRDHAVDDYRLIDFKGAGFFVAYVNQIVDEGAQDGDSIVLDTSTPQGALVLASLSSKATRVIRGTR